MRDFNLDSTASPTSNALAPLPVAYVEEQVASSKLFEHPAFGNLRVHQDEAGELWFVAKDVADALGYSKSSTPAVLFKAVPDQWISIKRIDTKKGERTATMISTQGLYFFLGRSDKGAALPYQMWIAGEVVPAIQKHGGYLTPKLAAEALLDPDVIINLATTLKKDREKLAAARQEVYGLRQSIIQVEQEKAALTADLAEAQPKAALVDEAFAPKHSSDEEGRVVRLQDVVRKLEHANSMAIKRDLYRMGYLYKRNGVYRVYSKYRETIFKERWSHEHAKQEIYATKDGAALIVKLYREGSLTRKGKKTSITNRKNMKLCN